MSKIRQGFNCRITHSRFNDGRPYWDRDITEIHFNYPTFSQALRQSTVFESNIRQTGESVWTEEVFQCYADLPDGVLASGWVRFVDGFREERLDLEKIRSVFWDREMVIVTMVEEVFYCPTKDVQEFEIIAD